MTTPQIGDETVQEAEPSMRTFDTACRRSIDRDKRTLSLEKDGTVAPHTPDLWTPIDGGAER